MLARALMCPTIVLRGPFEDEPGGGVRRKAGNNNNVGALHLVRDGFGHHEQIVYLPVASGSRWCVDDPSYLA